jgi:hypothetical protein
MSSFQASGPEVPSLASKEPAFAGSPVKTCPQRHSTSLVCTRRKVNRQGGVRLRSNADLAASVAQGWKVDNRIRDGGATLRPVGAHVLP